jgi:hypothetical protein
MSDVISSAREFLRQFVPAATETVILIVVTLYIVGFASALNAISSSIPRLSVLTDPEILKVVQAYGISSLLPFLLAFGLVVLALGTSKAIHTIGNMIPGHLAWSSYGVVLRTVNPTLIADVWIELPHISGIAELEGLIDQRIRQAETDQNKPIFQNAVFHAQRYGDWYGHWVFLKFLVFWSAILTIITVRWLHHDDGIVSRFAIVIILTSLGIVISIRSQLRSLRDACWAKFSEMKTYLTRERSLMPRSDKLEPYLEIVKKVKFEVERDRKRWYLGFLLFRPN